MLMTRESFNDLITVIYFILIKWILRSYFSDFSIVFFFLINVNILFYFITDK